jgi:hypothetical protein
MGCSLIALLVVWAARRCGAVRVAIQEARSTEEEEVKLDIYDNKPEIRPAWAVGVLSNDDNKPVWPTWVVGALFSGAISIRINLVRYREQEAEIVMMMTIITLLRPT